MILARRRHLTWHHISGAAVAMAAIAAASFISWPGDVGEHAASTTRVGATTVPAAPASVVITPPPGATGVHPTEGVSATVTGGVLQEVSLVTHRGAEIPGAVASDGQSWTPAAPLDYGETYTLTATGVGTNKTAVQQRSTFTTLSPQAQAAVKLHTTSGASLRDGATYGVGVVVVAKFDRAVTDRAAAERSLIVHTRPAVEGSWYWLDGQTAHWRPEHYYSPGTEVTVRAEIYGVALGDGVYGAEDSTIAFRIGDAHVSIADDRTKQIQVYENGTLVRTMPTSMGKGGTRMIGGATLAFWTQPGVYTVLDKSDTVLMDSSTYGLPLDLGYKLTVNYAVRLTHNGIYLHQLDSTVWAQGNTNVSHGCLNLNAENARWFYEFSRPGDVVEVRNTGGEPLSVWQNGDWSLPWDTWRKGSALT